MKSIPVFLRDNAGNFWSVESNLQATFSEEVQEICIVTWCGTQPHGESMGGGVQNAAMEGGCDGELDTSPRAWD